MDNRKILMTPRASTCLAPLAGATQVRPHFTSGFVRESFCKFIVELRLFRLPPPSSASIRLVPSAVVWHRSVLWRHLAAAGLLGSTLVSALPVLARSPSQTSRPHVNVVAPAASAAASAASDADGALLANDRSDGPIQLTADQITSRINQDAIASGDVALRRGGLSMSADMMRYVDATQMAFADGNVVLSRAGDRYTGSHAEVQVVSQSGTVDNPTYYFARTKAGGKAERIDFDDPNHLHIINGNYSSCQPEEGQEPDWILKADRLDIDFPDNEARAEGGVLHFLGVPILAAPVITFPATSEPKSGLLPPMLSIDSKGGFEINQQYYWRIAPNYDLTMGPIVSSKRDPAIQGEFRFLTDHNSGQVGWHYLPYDKTVGDKRYSLQAQDYGDDGHGLTYTLDYEGASDDEYWKDFSGILPSTTKRLLSQEAGVSKLWDINHKLSVEAYGKVQAWQTLQDTDAPITVPYQRAPQLGVHLNFKDWYGLNFAMETEANRFVLDDQTAKQKIDDQRPEGDRFHVLASISRPFDAGWGWFTPKMAVNSAAYSLDKPMSDGRVRAERTIPTFSVDSGLRFERDVSWFGSGLMQTLEPRVHFVQTPWRNQNNLPEFDSYASDFNANSIYADNEYTGVDRVSDEHEITVGATTRFIDDQSGIERLRLGAAQRFQFRDQHLSSDGDSSTKRASDLLLFASGQLTRAWSMDTTLEYDADTRSSARTVVSARYNPGPFQTISATYRYTRALTEQVELGFQWPLYHAGGTGQKGNCHGTWYGVGQVNYSIKDGRTTDSIAGVEYDAGCWILRVVNRRESTGQTEMTQRWMIQLEFVGLSAVGTNPLQTLKDNIPGYRLLRDDGSDGSNTGTP